MGLGTYLRALAGTKAKPDRSAAMIGGTATPYGERMTTYTSYLNAIKTVPHVYDAVSVIGYNVATARLRILDEDDQEVDIKADVPALHRLLTQPNRETDFVTFGEFLAYDMLLTGNHITALDNWTALGIKEYGSVPTEMYRLRPDQVRKRRRPDGTIDYGYEVGAQGIVAGQTVWYGPDEILDRRTTNPLNPLWGLGVIEAGELAFSSARAVTELTYNYLNNGAVLRGVLTADIASKDQYDDLQTRWRALYEGARNQLKVAILSQGATYTPVQEPLGSIPIVDLKRMGRSEVLQLFGVPPQMLGDFEGTSYRNAQEARGMFWSDTVTPLLVRLEPGWTRLAALFGPYHAAYEEKGLLDLDTRSNTALQLAQTGAMSVNKIYAAAGFDPLDDDDPLGEMIVIPKGTVLQSPDEITAPPAPPPPPPDTHAPGPEADPGDPVPPAVQGTDDPIAGHAVQAPPARNAGTRGTAASGRKSVPPELLSPRARRDLERRRRESRQGDGP